MFKLEGAQNLTQNAHCGECRLAQTLGIPLAFRRQCTDTLCDGSLTISGCRPLWRAAIVLSKAAPEHPNRFGVKFNVARNETNNLTHDAPPLAGSARRPFHPPWHSFPRRARRAASGGSLKPPSAVALEAALNKKRDPSHAWTSACHVSLGVRLHRQQLGRRRGRLQDCRAPSM